MATGFYLLDHKNRVQQYGEKRRGGHKPSGTIVIHTAENIADQIGEDLGAESVARYCLNRTDHGAYHRIVDADSIIRMAPFGYETWQCRVTNPWSIGISAAVRAGDWKKYGDAYETRVLRNLARAAAEAVHDLKKHWGVTVPIKLISGDDARAKKPGFTAHGRTDPTRRSDPGADFDWSRFLSMVRAELDGSSQPTPQEEPMADGLNTEQATQLSTVHGVLTRKLTDGSGATTPDQIWQRTLDVSRRTLVAVQANNAALTVAMETLAKNVGVDPAIVTAAVEKAVREALPESITIPLED